MAARIFNGCDFLVCVKTYILLIFKIFIKVFLNVDGVHYVPFISDSMLVIRQIDFIRKKFGHVFAEEGLALLKLVEIFVFGQELVVYFLLVEPLWQSIQFIKRTVLPFREP